MNQLQANIESVKIRTEDGSIFSDGAIVSDKIDWATVFQGNIVIVSDPKLTRATYFGGTFSTQFTAPVSGTWVLFDAWTGVFHRTANIVNNLNLNVDGNLAIVYRYLSEEGDTAWGTSRRTLNGSQKILSLSAGIHTLSTSGNLYPDATYGPLTPQIFLVRIV